MTNGNDNLEVYGIGTKVSLTESVEAKIVSILIYAENTVRYECAWWSGDNITKGHFSSSDFIKIGEKSEPTKIGFLRV